MDSRIDDRRLLDVLDRRLGAAAERAGPWLKCAPGCSSCCHGPFPISVLDVRRLRRGLERLAARDPQRARRLRSRVARAVGILCYGYPGSGATGRLDSDERALDRFFERHRELACPVMDPLTGHCDLYDARPVACRTYGPPLRFGGHEAPPCRLCFVGADEATLERCRVDPDPQDLETKILCRLGVADGEQWHTLVAFGLSCE